MSIDSEQAREFQEELSGDGTESGPMAFEITPVELGAGTEERADKLESSEEFSPLDLDDRVVISLIYHQVVQIEQVDKAWHRMRELESSGESVRLWRVLAEEPEMDKERVYTEAAKVFKIKTAQIDKQDALNCLRGARTMFTPEQWSRMQALHLLPIHRQESPEKWTFATFDPLRHEVHAVLKSLELPQTDLVYAPETFTTELITEGDLLRNEYFERVVTSENVVDIESEGLEFEEVDDSLEAEIARSALINLFEAALVEAVHRGVSDIHIFPNKDGHVAIHFRVNGDLETWYVEKFVRPEALLAVVKDQALNVDRFEREKGQDGFIQRKIDGTLIRFRVSVLPVAGVNARAKLESIVIRVLDDRKVIASLEELGLSPNDLAIFENAIRQPTGIVILTGPTGSGKTTTLYAALQEITTPKRNVLTAEDPVEYVLPGVRQIRISHKLGISEALRFILRHDPDVVMVGEIRDQATAELAVHVANTGHLTFSTLHTNDAPSALSRLFMMGIEPFLVAHSINLIVAQRLIRVLCPDCKEVSDEDPEFLKHAGFLKKDLAGVTLYQTGHDTDCQMCAGSGFQGRRAVTEMLQITPEIRSLVAKSDTFLNEDAVRKQAEKDGMRTLLDAVRTLVLSGETSISELVRTVGTSTH